MIDLHTLPLVNALLNGLSACLLLVGFAMIRMHQKTRHRKFMIAAFVSSSVFLVSYLVYHAAVGTVHYEGTGMWRLVYLSILTSHTILAVSVPPLAIVALSRGLSNRIDRHKRIARLTLPVWLYVSVTGVIIYVMLYHL